MSISLLDDVAVPFAMSSVMLCGVDVMGVIPGAYAECSILTAQ